MKRKPCSEIHSSIFEASIEIRCKNSPSALGAVDSWLCALEILEIVAHEDIAVEFSNKVRGFIEAQKIQYTNFAKLIDDGLAIIDAQLTFQ